MMKLLATRLLIPVGILVFLATVGIAEDTTVVSPLVSYQYLAAPDAAFVASPQVSYQYLSGPDSFFGTSPIVSYEFTGGLSDDAALVSQSPALDAAMNPRQSFTATLRLRNTGTTTWQAGAQGHTLNFMAGQRMGAATTGLMLASSVAPGAEATFSVALTAPTTPGNYTGNWRMNGPAPSGSGHYFGETVSIRIVVPLPPGDPPEYTPTGFVYPTGRSNAHNGMAGWLYGGPAMPPYLTGYYHLGVDMAGAAGAPVYSISDGEIVYVSTGGWGSGNHGLLVRHTLADGQEFLALYGHVRPLRSSLRLSSPGAVLPPVPVRAGEVFATIGLADGYSPTHLHFGIRPSNAVPPAPFGKMPLASWPQTNGFVDPMDWLLNRTPLTAQALQSPDAPRNLLSVALSTIEAQVTWQAGERAADGFKIQRKVGTTGAWQEIGDNITGTTQYCDTGLTANTMYFYRALAYNSAGQSPYCTAATVTTPLGSLQPQIDRVDPACPVATGSLQPFSIQGKNFLAAASVSLRPPSGVDFSPTSYTSPSQNSITFDIVFDSSQIGNWFVEVANPGGDRTVHHFTVGSQPAGTELEINEEQFLTLFHQSIYPELPLDRYPEKSLAQLVNLDETVTYSTAAGNTDVPRQHKGQGN